ncbi:MAG: molybdopterin biosynthesis protein MoeB [Deltaproteobacteria bacterium RIFCSPLOWO2_02_56_12]|nr:MAG: molybdopterin biosynthesis protein MoeB [Deltaproteobacteria bacterium GWD2_55_8]OGQ51764.1 MAG: molybdopterin biosynthesis protein MoeB [Deltaproteobacteria bacterium RIFCSPLOWO2_02_56_12]OGQ96711.1 MAG: molybdopterin biosynthesis protein MoeB [Deltaproteobacteria bacterium RIFOXYA2_FULL_55_11]HBA38677.1 molybdopterin biosynthesis protein MoeB [Deltaproteobacteria bacterium]
MAKTFKQLMDEARNEIKEISAQEADELLKKNGKYLLLDVREKDEYREGHLEGALSLPRGFLEIKIESAVPDKSTPILAYCAGGVRSLLAANALKEMGYQDVISMSGGYTAWKTAGYNWVQDHQFSPEQVTRYSRHFLLPEVGEEGQAKLLQAKVLMVGAGGLGSPSAYYLAAAGVGTLGIIDNDVVDLSNLQRQILHTNDRIGMPKTESAKLTIQALNPDVRVIPFQQKLTSQNIMEIIKDYDIVVDGCDNFPTRYLVNDACVLTKKPNVHGSIFQFEGQASVFYPGKGPCYRCLYPEPPPADMAPSCQEAGVLGVLPGLIGVIQALETIKLILGKGDTLVGRLLCFNTLTMEINTLKLMADPACPMCGEKPTIHNLVDYEEFCSLRAAHAA